MDSVEKTLMLGKIEGSKRAVEEEIVRKHHRLNGQMNMNLSKLWEIVKDRGTRHAIVHGVAKSPTCLGT